MLLSPRLAEFVKRPMPADAVDGPAPTPPHPTNASASSHSTLSTGGGIAVAVSICVVLLLISLTAVYFICWRGRKKSPQPELEVGEDGRKVTMQAEKEHRRWWGRRSSGTSQDTLVRDDESTRGSVVVRNDA